MPSFLTHSAQESRDLAHTFARTLSGGDVVLFEGDLGSGKTTFIQGILEYFGAEKPYTSPTFVIVKTYNLRPTTNDKQQQAEEKNDLHPNSQTLNSQLSSPLLTTHYNPLTIHHTDTYRIESKDLISLGWEEMLQEKNSLILLEWPERVRDILPERAKAIFFKHKGEDEREIILPE